VSKEVIYNYGDNSGSSGGEKGPEWRAPLRDDQVTEGEP